MTPASRLRLLASALIALTPLALTGPRGDLYPAAAAASGFVAGHDFSRAEEDPIKRVGALLPAAFHPRIVNAFAAATPLQHPHPHPTLRIGMWTLWHDRQLNLSPAGSATLRACQNCPPTTLTHPLTIHAVANAIAGAAPSPQSTLLVSGSFILTAHNESATLHHPLRVTARHGELILAVTLPLETYVEQVVASEAGPAATLQSLRALAIVVRTYALHVPHGHADYDLCDSTHCQLLHWRRVPDRPAAAHAATLSTAGETLWFHHQPALAWFNKDCGGYTASPAEIWPAAHAVPYLPSRPDPYCVRGSGSEWASDMSRADIAAALAARGLAAPGWQHLAVARRDPSGRVLTVRLDARQVPAEDFRLAIGAALGWNRIPSTWFEVAPQGDRYYFHGRGWGHGVGLCQKGAAEMAAQAHSMQEILAQYFPGAQAADESTGRSWEILPGPGFSLQSLDANAARFLPEIARCRAEASQRSGLDPTAAFTVRAFPSTPAFRDATLSPGWVAAFTEGDWIATQPLSILAARHLLAGTLLHEFLHALVESQAGPQAPLWLREGIVEVWSEPAETEPAMSRRSPVQPLASVDAALAHAASEAQSAAAHRDAAIYAARLLDRYGRAQILAWLRSGLPAGVLVTLR